MTIHTATLTPTTQTGNGNYKILVLFGGESSEHDVSVRSAKNVIAAIDTSQFEVFLGYIDRGGRWWHVLDFEGIDGATKQALTPHLGTGTFMIGSRNLSIDAVLPILHGKNGEDGSVQGLAQLMHVPIVGCDMTASALGMDKVASKRIVGSGGVPIVPYATHRTGEAFPQFDQLADELGTPLFVKPARAGSSVGVSKVRTSDELTRALKLAHQHDPVVLIEQAIAARELEVAVLGQLPKHQVSTVGEIIPGAEFYSYDDKYASDSGSVAQIPARIDAAVSAQVRQYAAQIYELLGCAGLSRIDFFLSPDGKLYFNEINTLPGFTSISMYPKLWQYDGLSYTNLITRLLLDAIACYNKVS